MQDRDAGHAALTASSVRFVDEIAACATVFDADVNAVVLQRTATELPTPDEDLRARLTVPLLLVVPVGEAGQTLLRGELGPAFGDEVFLWCEVLAELTGAERTGLRLARPRAPMCPRFHVDRVTLRLVCTYEGEGTEVLAHEDVDRRWLGVAGPREGGGEPSSLLLPGARVHRASRGDVVVLKGEAWPGNRGRGCVHRSPAQPSADPPRLVLTLDPLA